LLYATIALAVAQIAWPVVVFRHLADAAREQRSERAALLDRIQAPEAAQVQAFQIQTAEPAHLPFDDDGAWQAYMTREAPDA
jgi:hypothetical protein